MAARDAAKRNLEAHEQKENADYKAYCDQKDKEDAKIKAARDKKDAEDAEAGAAEAEAERKELEEGDAINRKIEEARLEREEAMRAETRMLNQSRLQTRD